MTQLTRREIFAHAGALGLGAMLLPRTGTLAWANTAAENVKTPEGIVLETIEAGGIAHYSYFLADTKAGTAVVIDPRRDVDVYLELAKEHGLRITHAIDTHIHADFISGTRELAARSQTAAICASVEGDATYGFSIDHPLRHGDTIKVGRVTLRAIHTPGHTPEHMSFVAYSTDAPERPWALFTGDFLFVGSIGRPDLMGVENTEQLAEALFKSVGSALTDLPDGVLIYPAHGPGSPCGANIQPSDGSPTLGAERQGNPYWQMKDQEQFIKSLLMAQPPVPYYWPRMKKINAAGPEILHGKKAPEKLDPAAFKTLLARDGVQLLDTRSVHAFAGGHIDQAINIGYSETISMWGGWVLDPDRPIALVNPPGSDAAGPVDWLARVGLTNVEGVLDGGMQRWVITGHRFQSFPTKSIHELHEQQGSDAFQLVDVRQPSEWDKGHLSGAQYLFLPEIPARLDELDRNKPVVVYCGTGYRASVGASLLRKAGFDARSVPGSYDAWIARGLPVVRPQTIGKASDTKRS